MIYQAILAVACVIAALMVSFPRKKDLWLWPRYGLCTMFWMLALGLASLTSIQFGTHLERSGFYDRTSLSNDSVARICQHFTDGLDDADNFIAWRDAAVSFRNSLPKHAFTGSAQRELDATVDEMIYDWDRKVKGVFDESKLKKNFCVHCSSTKEFVKHGMCSDCRLLYLK